MLQFLGVPICERSIMFGDNKSVVDSSTSPNAKLNKRHTMLSFHCVCEAIAHHFCAFFHIDGELNPADILSKHWSYTKVRDLLQALMFVSGDTMQLYIPDGKQD